MDALERILRFRRLTEQQARRELERATLLLRAATAACERQSRTVAEQRATLAHSWQPEESGIGNRPARPGDGNDAPAIEGGTRGWLIAEAALEFSGWNRALLEQLCASEARRIEPLVAHFVECRRALRQTEKLIEQRAESARVEQERQMQADGDEWYLQQKLRHRRLGSRTASGFPVTFAE